jgi:flagellar biosynthesis protein FlhB
MEEEGNPGDRPHAATPEKLRKAREKGEAPQSRELLTTAAFAIVVAGIALGGHEIFRHTGMRLRSIIANPGAIGDLETAGAAIWEAVVLPVSLLLVLPIVGVLLAAKVQQNLFFASNRIAPKWSRISPMANAKQKFGPPGWMEFLKALIKAGAVCGTLTYLLLGDVGRLVGLPRLPVLSLFAETARLAEFIFYAGLAVALPLVVADVLWQRHQHAKQQRMSHEELRSETKDAEGDPILKSRRRERGMAYATAGMLQEVSKADVVIMNPTHYAVALKWDGGADTAPVCVAKGADHVALAIRRQAVDSAVPVRQDPPLARALFATVEVGAMIRVEHYAAVAAAIRFARMVRQRGGTA